MDNNHKNNNKQNKEDKDMSVVLEKEYLSLKDKLNKISKNAPILKTKNGMIELNPNNPQHKEWFEEDKGK